mmetsp:Transcript_7059/g.13358  ORF Transcript_7059/g.13358 Transcript_7059/m.13358 type:complete len:219 (-) Transcript_7059:110-766(-)|eukprot:CAMPEP_0175140650 /NCGR_PEP_ID=MMETSP0087-20121206/11638_1 /TAXON_ID=136419 /ORGANISM="Unknown Unknown, Strain D1" /LENGTH=218 /DNA_ID=CAMNT_0016423919 /DNA_START=45 /DNA_END=701 /DNA_ORIENTATION=+
MADNNDDNPPPPPPEEEAPPPPAPDSDDDEEDAAPGGFSVIVEAPPPPDNAFAMTAEEAATHGLANLRKRVLEIAMSELLVVGPDAPSLTMQMISMASKPVPAKAVFALVVLFWDWDTQGEEGADMLDVEWTDHDATQTQDFLKATQLDKKDHYSINEVKDCIDKKLQQYVDKHGAEECVPSMLEYVTDKLKEKSSLNSNFTFRQSVDLGHVVAEQKE